MQLPLEKATFKTGPEDLGTALWYFFDSSLFRVCALQVALFFLLFRGWLFQLVSIVVHVVCSLGPSSKDTPAAVALVLLHDLVLTSANLLHLGLQDL